MSRLQKSRIPHVLQWVALLSSEIGFTSSKSNLYVNGSYNLLQHHRFSSTKSALCFENGRNTVELSKVSRVVRREAQAALLEYFHSTRSLQMTDAENMSKNAPEFFDGLLKKVDMNDPKHSLARFLRYHPVNEFEPFFESIGLKPSEYGSFLPRNLLFLNDDRLLLENYYVLCNYGVPRNRIGKIYKEAREVFGYEYGVLKSKLQAFQNLGLKQSLLVKIIASSPYLLRGNVDREFVKVLEKLKDVGIGYDWLEEHMFIEDSYNWRSMLKLVCLLTKLDLDGEQVKVLLVNHPDILLESSGCITSSLLGFLLKFGPSESDLQSLFLNFPQIQIVKFSKNLFNCYEFLVEIDMGVQDIFRIVRSCSTVLGSCELKRVRSLMTALNCGKYKLRQVVKQDPLVLKEWVLGLKVEALQEPNNRVLRARTPKTKFLLSLGFEEKSEEMEKALKVLKGRGVELQERFDCLVKIGFDREQVIQMVKMTPQFLNQSKDVIEKKIELLVKDLGYPLSDLLTHPKLLSYTVHRVKLRLSMHKWLADEKVVRPNLALSTLLSMSQQNFVKTYVNRHPRGHEYWEELKKKYAEDGSR